MSSDLYPRHYNQRGKPVSRSIAVYDKWLIIVSFALVVIGLMMVASSSVEISIKRYNQPFFFLIHQLCYLSIGIVVAIVVLRIDSSFWERVSFPLLFICFLLLSLVLVPGLGRLVNGSRRWLAFGPIGIQVSELAKLMMIFYFSSYLVRHKECLSKNALGFIKPMIILSLVSCLLIAEPDFGATVVICGTVLAMLFLAGISLRYYISLIFLVGASLLVLAISSPYRLARLTTFFDPWADQFDSGYQLTQSLIAFGRGGWYGMGLGESVQKLFYLPEAHTDFLFAVFAEEFGLIGVLFIIFLYVILVFRGLLIAYNAYVQERFFAAYTAYGLVVWLGLQVIINIGVNAGLLPTKGLTLPFLSYGGASILINCVLIALLLRIDHENRWHSIGIRTST